MTVIKAHFDGRVIVPDEPLDLPKDCRIEVQLRRVEQADPEDRPLMRLLKRIQELPAPEGGPTDGAAQVDHYLYGAPKRP
jgi:hypothetical protein